MSASSELEQFRDFINEHLNKPDGSRLLPEEILELWRLDHPIPEELAASVADLEKAIEEMESGVEGTPAKDLADELRLIPRNASARGSQGQPAIGAKSFENALLAILRSFGK